MDLEVWRKFNLSLIGFFVLALGGYFLTHAQPYLEVLRYEMLLNSPFAPTEINQDDILKVHAQSEPVRAETATASEPEGTYKLYVPKISVETPIVKPADTSKEGVLASLESGVGLYPNSVMPGEDGRTVLLGHSSRASWYRGEYAYVFSLLSKLEKGDEFSITAPDKKIFKYKVLEVLTLSPDEANSFFEKDPVGPEVDLVTCYPVGSASQRTVVRAQMIN